MYSQTKGQGRRGGEEGSGRARERERDGDKERGLKNESKANLDHERHCGVKGRYSTVRYSR